MKALFLALGLWGSAASASDVELTIERARAAQAADETAPALAWASKAALAGADPFEAWRLYLFTAHRAGLGAVAEAALDASADPMARLAVAWSRMDVDPRGLEDFEPVTREARMLHAWSRMRRGQLEDALPLLVDEDPETLMMRAVALRELGRRSALRKTVLESMKQHPRHPGILGELWKLDNPRGLKSLRRRAQQHLDELLATDDRVAVYRASNVALASMDDRLGTKIVDRMEQLGEPLPPVRRRLPEAMQKQLGEALGNLDDAEWPWLRPSEVPHVVLGFQDAAVRRGRGELGLELWDRLPEHLRTWQVAMAHAQLALDLGRPREAIRFAELAQAAAAAPAWSDLGRLDGARQKQEFAYALGLEAEAQFELGRGTASLARAWLAYQLDPSPRWGAMWLRAQFAVGPSARDRALFDLVAAADPNDDHAAALAEAALREAARMDADHSTSALDDTLAALVLRALANRSLVDASIVSLLAPDQAATWRLRAVLAEREGHDWLAFGAHAMADGLGADSTSDLERTFPGLGSANAGAAAAVASWRASFSKSSQASEPADADALPALGAPMPAWQVTTLDGARVDSASLAGRPYVLSLWASWCGPCLVELPEIARVVESLAAQGTEVPVVAISVDERRDTAVRTAKREHWRGLTLGWTDDRRGAFGMGALPTTWVVGSDGRVVYVQTGYDENFARRLGRILREHAD